MKNKLKYSFRKYDLCFRYSIDLQQLNDNITKPEPLFFHHLRLPCRVMPESQNTRKVNVSLWTLVSWTKKHLSRLTWPSDSRTHRDLQPRSSLLVFLCYSNAFPVWLCSREPRKETKEELIAAPAAEDFYCFFEKRLLGIGPVHLAFFLSFSVV